MKATTRSGAAFFGVLFFIVASVAGAQPVAVVDGVEIDRESFEAAVYTEGRQTFYHGAPQTPDAVIQFRRDIANRMIDRVLLLKEARRRGLEPDNAAIQSELEGYEARYGNTPRWQEEGEAMLERVRGRLEEDSLIARLEASVKVVGDPDEGDVRAYYDANPEKFTEPVRNRVAVILLAVMPNAGEQAWDAARSEAGDLVGRIAGGADFADLARMHSADPSARNGGDMGYLHAGMLAPEAQSAVDALALGEVSEPVTVLEGVAILKLLDRTPAELRSFDDVRDRAAGLWRREAGEQAWDALVASLRAGSEITLDEAYIGSLPGASQ